MGVHYDFLSIYFNIFSQHYFNFLSGMGIGHIVDLLGRGYITAINNFLIHLQCKGDM